MKLPPSSGDRPWQTDPVLDPFRHPVRPDDVEANFHFWRAQRVESLWVSLRAVDPAVSGYIGELIDEPHTPGGPASGDLVSIRVAPGCAQPIWVSPEMRANRARWKSICTVCGFDMLMRPADVIAATQFPDAPDGCVPVVFSTLCAMCGETMQVNPRV